MLRLLRHAQECSPSAQVKAAAAHVQTLKQNQRKKKLSLTLVVVDEVKVSTLPKRAFKVFVDHVIMFGLRKCCYYRGGRTPPVA